MTGPKNRVMRMIWFQILVLKARKTRRWKVLLWLCREIPFTDPRFEELGGEHGEDEWVMNIKRNYTLGSLDVFVVALLLGLGVMTLTNWLLA